VKVSQEERKQRRREKQRIIARNFRKRKKENQKRLEEEVKRLRIENEIHRTRLNLVPDQRVEKNDVKSMTKLVDVEDEMSLSHVKPVKMSSEKFENSVNFHFEELKALTPCDDDLSKMILLGLGNDDPQQQQDVWSEMLCPSLELTNQQQSQLQGKNLSNSFHEMTHLMKELESFRRRFKTCVNNVRNAVSEVSDSFSAVQHAKYLVWKETSDSNRMLQQMWDKKLSE